MAYQKYPHTNYSGASQTPHDTYLVKQCRAHQLGPKASNHTLRMSHNADSTSKSNPIDTSPHARELLRKLDLQEKTLSTRARTAKNNLAKPHTANHQNLLAHLQSELSQLRHLHNKYAEMCNKAENSLGLEGQHLEEKVRASTQLLDGLDNLEININHALMTRLPQSDSIVQDIQVSKAGYTRNHNAAAQRHQGQTQTKLTPGITGPDKAVHTSNGKKCDSQWSGQPDPRPMVP